MTQITPSDVRALLDPTVGLARQHQLVRLPEAPHLYVMVVDIGTRFAGTDGPTVHDLTGAYDLTADGAAVRGLGEAVERRALVAGDGTDIASLEGTRAELVAAGLSPAADQPGHWPQGAAPTTWYPAEEVGTPRTWHLPAAWVDCPADGPFRARWEGSPSGAAAHTSLAAATTGAIGELLERDALMRAWYRTDRAGAVELDLDPVPHPWLTRLVHDQPQVRVRAARVPTVLPGRYGYVAWVDDGTTVGTGATVATQDPVGAARAVLEAWQIFQVLRARSAQPPAAPVSGTSPFHAVGEERCDFWTDGRGRASMLGWAEALPAAEPLTSGTVGPDPEPDLAAALREAGHPVLRVDLTPRLPAAVRDAGFVAVKVVVDGLHPLVLDERAEWCYVPELLGGRPAAGFQPLI